jgi:hypothetical protein
VFFHNCVQITDYKEHLYRLHVVSNRVHTDHKVLLYTLQVTSNMLQITRYILTDYKRHKIFSSVSLFHQMVAVLIWTEHRNAPVKIPSQNGRPSFTVTAFVIHVKDYRLAGCILKPAAYVLQVILRTLFIFVLIVSSSKTHSIGLHF